MKEFPHLAALMALIYQHGQHIEQFESLANAAANEARIDGMEMAREEVSREARILPQLSIQPTATATCERISNDITSLMQSFADSEEM